MLTSENYSQRENADIVCKENKLDFSSLKQQRYGLCCPNCMEYREFVYKQIDEMLEYFTLDGFFFDMPFWSKLCHCDACKKRWAI